MWRCLNDNFGYCKTEPKVDKEPTQAFYGSENDPLPTGLVMGGTCLKDPKTCRQYLTHTKLLKALQVKTTQQA